MQVRAVNSHDERELFSRFAIEVYQPHADMESRLSRNVSELAALPDLPRGGQRLAFVDDEIAGGYLLRERDLLVGPALLRTGCIGTVYTRHAFRKQGVASAMMQDAIAYAVDKDYALLLLDGISNFYDKFGYVDMHDVTHFSMKTTDLLLLDTGAWQMQLATEDDADLLHDLYQRHYGDYIGSFERSLEMQQFKLRTASPGRRFVLALNPEGAPKGYIVLREDDRQWAAEVAAESWEAAKVLLKHQAEFAAADEKPSKEIEWAVPPGSELAMMLVAHLSVKQTKESVYAGGWMARVGNVDALLHSLLPVWNQRLAASGLGWTGTFDLHLDDRRWQLAFDSGSVRIDSDASAAAQSVRLTQQQLVKLCFAYPSLDFAARGALADLTSPAAQSLRVMFDGNSVWIAGTDFF